MDAVHREAAMLFCFAVAITLTQNFCQQQGFNETFKNG